MIDSTAHTGHPPVPESLDSRIQALIVQATASGVQMPAGTSLVRHSVKRGRYPTWASRRLTRAFYRRGQCQAGELLNLASQHFPAVGQMIAGGWYGEVRLVQGLHALWLGGAQPIDTDPRPDVAGLAAAIGVRSFCGDWSPGSPAAGLLWPDDRCPGLSDVQPYNATLDLRAGAAGAAGATGGKVQEVFDSDPFDFGEI